MRKNLAACLIALALLAGCAGSAAAPKSASDCEKLGSDLRNDCYFKLGTQAKDTAICDKIPDSDLYLFGCYAGIAIEKNDLSVCSGIEAGGNSKEDNTKLCREEVANECTCYGDVKEGHAPFCGQVKAMGIRGACE